MTPERIAIVAPLPPWRGGISHHSMMLGEALTQRADVRGFSFSRLYPDALFPGRSQRDPLARRAGFPVEEAVDSMNPFAWAKASRSIMEYEPDVVAVAWWHPMFAPALTSVVGASRRMGARIVVVVHNVRPHAWFPLSDDMADWMFRNADGCVAMTGQVADAIERLESKVPVRIAGHPPYNQFDRGRYTRASAREALGLGREKVVLFFGMVRAYKRLSVLLDAWPRVHEATGATLIVAGEFYDDRRRLMAKVDALRGVRVFDEYVDDAEVERYFRAADVLAMPYLPRSQSGAEATATAFGLPVAGPTGGCAHEMAERLLESLSSPPACTTRCGATWEAAAAAVIDAANGQQWMAR